MRELYTVLKGFFKMVLFRKYIKNLHYFEIVFKRWEKSEFDKWAEATLIAG